MTCWLNGQLCDAPHLDATSAGALLGWGVFTTVGVRAARPLLFERHCARLRRDAAATRIAFEWDDAILRAGLDALMRANGIEDGIARLTLLRRDDGRWNTRAGSDLLMVAQASIPAPAEGARVVVSPHRWSSQRPLVGVKTTSYLPYFLTWHDAREAGYDEALLLGDEATLCEGARSNLFWATGGQLYTPSLSTGCLPGIGREWALEWANGHALVAHEGAFSLSSLWDADEAFLISAASGPRAIATLSHPQAGQMRDFSSPGLLTRALQDAWRQL